VRFTSRIPRRFSLLPEFHRPAPPATASLCLRFMGLVQWDQAHNAHEEHSANALRGRSDNEDQAASLMQSSATDRLTDAAQHEAIRQVNPE